MIDTNTLNSKYSLIDLAGQHTTLGKESKAEFSGPCPKCGGEDRFHVTEEMFFCRQCYPLDNGQPHDAIAFVQFVGQAHDFKAACALLGGESLPEPTTPKRKPERKPKTPGWKSPLWQRDVKATLEDAQDRLWNRDDGDPGRAYLRGRGLRPDMAIAFGLGLADVWHPKRKEKRPAILMPWQGQHNVAAVQYRFIDPDLDKKERFSQRRGGDRLLFGWHLFEYTEADTLILCEGELNAASIFQVVFKEYPVHVLSFGPQENVMGTTADLAGKIAHKYDHIVVWADEPERALSAMQVVDAGNVLAIKSPGGMDANDMLQSGILERFLVRLLWRQRRQRWSDKTVAEMAAEAA